MERSYPGGPSTAARTAVVWEVLRREISRGDATSGMGSGAGLRVVDVGGGTGGFAVPLAVAGHRVTVIDASPDALAALVRRAAEAGVSERIRAEQGDADSVATLVDAGSADIVLCHSVLEVVDEPGDVVRSLFGVLRPGGAASVLVANRAAAVLTRAVSGGLEAALELLRDRDGRAGARDTLRRRFDAESARAMLAEGGLVVEEIHGVRVVADLVPATVLERDAAALTAFELATAAINPYRDVASLLHLLARRP